MPDALEMVRSYLMEHGYDGLYDGEGDGCGCGLEDLAPCGEMKAYCEAGYKVTECPPGGEPGCDFWIVAENQKGKTLKKKTTRYTPEFRGKAVRIFRDSEESIGTIAKDLGVAKETLSHWVRQANRTNDSRREKDIDLLSWSIKNVPNTEFVHQPRWHCVANLFGLGSGSAMDLCRRFGHDPDAMIDGVTCRECEERED